ncbi:MAG: hypothetical protein GXN95_05790 [Methanococci archaeon]|nr:hypothetical protein [Methanococci archaeon]
MELKIIPKNDPYLLDVEVSGSEEELLKLEEAYKTTELSYLIFDLAFNNNKATFTIIKQDLDAVKLILKNIEKEVEDEGEDDRA